MADRPWRWYVALDGGELDGLLGAAGLMRFDWPSRKLAFRYYDGLSGGHNPSLAPGGKLLLLGNFSQQIVVVDALTLDEQTRQTTMSIEQCDYRLRSTTHHLWYDDKKFICSVGDHLYDFSLDDLAHPTKLGPHRLWNVHELRWSGDRRYVLMGDLGPETEGARQVGIFDRETKQSKVIRLPGTVWHVAVDERCDKGYAATYSFTSEDDDYVDWSPAYTREYLFEIDLRKGEITRTWSSMADYPIHLNSDLEIVIHEREAKLYVASGGSHTVVEVDLGDFKTTRFATVTPPWWRRWMMWKQLRHNLAGAFMRRNPVTSLNQILQTHTITGTRYFDGIYAVRASSDGKYLVAGNRGYNYVRVMDRKTFDTVYALQLPTVDGLHLGMHHSEFCDGDGT